MENRNTIGHLNLTNHPKFLIELLPAKRIAFRLLNTL